MAYDGKVTPQGEHVDELLAFLSARQTRDGDQLEIPMPFAPAYLILQQSLQKTFSKEEPAGAIVIKEPL